jgi:hypothetical protein
MRRNATAIALLIPTFVGTLFGQHAVDPSERYHRLICLVYLKGTGTPSDPIRPEYVPTSAAADRSGILAWSFQITDDKNMAIVHYVAADRNAFQGILADKRPEIRIFEIGKDDRTKIETEMKKYRKDFNLDTMRLLIQ